MDCRSGERLLGELLEEKLDDAQAAPVIAHVESCPSCQERLRKLTSESSHFMRWGYFPFDRPSLGLSFQNAEIGVGTLADGNEPSSQSALARSNGDTSADGFPVIDGYDFVAELGHGGMGVVYQARQHRLSRSVAVKMIRAGSLARPEDLARFRLEAETVANLRHVNIIQIFDIGEVSGLPFVTFELLEGGSLDALLAAKPQTEEQAARLVATLARAMQVAHEAGVVHRDLKPSNVLFSLDGVPKITDFGLAKRLADDGHTETGQVMGSPSYIPPEQAEGRAKEVSPATDVYSLGAILYEMLTGRPPFKGDTPMETLLQVLRDDPVVPSRLQSNLSHDLETICLKCLSKEPDRRYASASALAEDLDRFLSGQPVQARRTPAWERALKLVRRRPGAASLLAIAAAVLLTTLVAGVRSYRDSRSKVLVEDRRLAALRDEAQYVLAEVRSQRVDGTDAIAELSRLDEKIRLQPRLGGLHGEVGQLLLKFRSRAEALGRYHEFFQRREDAFFQETELTALNPADNLVAVRTLTLKALGLYAAREHESDRWALGPLPDLTEPERNEVTLGCYEMLIVLAEAVARPLPGESSQRQARQALRILDRAAELLPEPTHAITIRRAACLERSGDLEGARTARAAAERIQPQGAFDQFLSGLERYKDGLFSQAKLHFESAIHAQPKHFWAKCLLAICNLNSRPHNPAEARTNVTACLQTHPDLPWLYILRGFANGQLGASIVNSDPVLAKVNFEAALLDYREAEKRDFAGRFRYALLVNRGLLHFHSHRSAEAIADLEHAIALNPRLINAYVTLAHVHHDEQRLGLAFENLTKAVALNPDQPALYRMRARWRLEQRSLTPESRAAALSDLREAIMLEPPSSPQLGDDYAEVARLMLHENQFDDALAACESSLRLNPDNPDVLRVKIVALLELKRVDDAVQTCDRYLASGERRPELFGLRGLAKSRRKDFKGAIEDYTRAIGEGKRDPVLHCRRGWAYLVTGAVELARDDFDDAIRLDPSRGEAYGGRGSTQVAMGELRAGVADAEESLQHGDVEAHIVYTAARTLAQAAQVAAKEARPRGKPDLIAIRGYQDRALLHLRRALEQMPRQTRGTFWRDVVQSDAAFNGIRQLNEYGRLAEWCRPSGP